MREIKFRAWDRTNRRMIPWDGMQAWMMSSLEHDNIMQFTGLKDKNGKEIWEGDVVRCSAVLDDSKIFNKQVVWSEGGFIANGSLGTNHHQLEIIGNIFDDPKLLTK